MTTFHYQGELLDESEGSALYRFFPDHVMAPEVSGTFRLRIGDWTSEFVEPADAEGQGLVSSDKHCVAALVHKIRKSYEASRELPLTVFFVA